MKTSIKIIALIFVATLSACATAPENLDRSVSFDWELNPESTQSQYKTVDMGEIFFEWDAAAYATHELDDAGQTKLLTQASSTKGNLFCTEPDGNVSCYEDRDGDGLLDHKWSVKNPPNSPVQISTARSPEELEAPISYRPTTQAKTVTMSQKLGLLYDGLQFGNINAGDQSVSNFAGRFLLGWHNGKEVARSANGNGWKMVKMRLAAKNDESPLTAKFVKPDAEVKMMSGTPDGTAKIHVKADTVSDKLEIKDLPNMELLRALLLSN